MRRFCVYFLGIMLSFLTANAFSAALFDEEVQANNSGRTLKIGDYYRGGVIFYLDNSTSPRRGLLVALNDADYTKSPLCGTPPPPLPNDLNRYGGCQGAGREISTKIFGVGFFEGRENTEKLLSIDNTPTGFPAAYVAHQYSTSEDPKGAYWYLPSISELYHLWSVAPKINKTIAAHGGQVLPTWEVPPPPPSGGIDVNNYWASDDSPVPIIGDWTHTRIVSFNKGFAGYQARTSEAWRGVRPVRTFTY